MKLHVIAGVAVLGFLVSGCSKKPDAGMPAADPSRDTVSNAEPKPPTETAPPTSDGKGKTANPTPAPSASPKPPAKVVEPDRVVNGIKQEKTYVIKGAGEGGWKPSSIKPADLADRVDTAIRSLQNVKGEMVLITEDKERRGMNTGQMEIVDAQNFYLLYQNPKSPEKSTSVVSVKGQRKELRDKSWEPVAPLGVTPDQILTNWADRFPEFVLSPLITGDRGFSPAVASLMKQEGGYRMVAEEQRVTAAGQTIPMFRILASRPSPATEIEFRFDGRTMVPLTLRINRTMPDGTKSTTQWQGRWYFGKPLDMSKIKLPS